MPDEWLDRLAAQYIAEEDPSPDVSEHDKIRRYRSILRDGAWAERQYAEATNVYRVREFMMSAARGLVTLEGTPETRQTLLEIAKRQNDPATPPQTRLVADLLLTRAELAALEDEPDTQAKKIEQFFGRYAETPAAAKSLMAAVELAKVASATTLRKHCLDALETKHLEEPDVASCLEREGVFPFHGRLVKCRLTLMDGTQLGLPRDMLGRESILYFWSMDRSELDQRGKGYTLSIPQAYKRLHAAGVEIIGINLDTDREKVAQFVKDEGLTWPQVCSGLGTKDPIYQRFAVPTVPAWWIITPDGRLYVNNYRNGAFGKVGHWGHTFNTCDAYASELVGTIGRAAYYRSGEFLFDEPNAMSAPYSASGDVPADRLQTIRRKVFLSPYLDISREKKAESFREVLALGRAAEAAHPKAGNLVLVRNWMLVAARWLGNELRDVAAARQAREIAAKILVGKPKGGLALLADYVQLSDQLAANDKDFLARITAFRRSYAETDVRWAANLLAVVLVLECGHEPTRVAWVREMAESPEPLLPKQRGFLRDFCYINVDAQVAEESFRMRGTHRYDPLRPIYEKWNTQMAMTPKPQVLRAQLPCLDGGVLKLPDPQKRIVILHFWSVACPPVVWPNQSTKVPTDDLTPTNKVLVVGVNLDESREEVEKFLKNDPKYKDWVHVFSGKGWNDPLAREMDILNVPRSLLISQEGKIHLWAQPGQFGRSIQDFQK